MAEPQDGLSVGSLLYATCPPHQQGLGHHIYKTETMMPCPRGLWGTLKELRQLKAMWTT